MIAPSTVMPPAEAGAVHAIAVTRKDRFALAPVVSTLAEAGVGVDVSPCSGRSRAKLA